MDIKQIIKKMWLKISDPRRLSEISGERVVFNHLRDCGFFNGFENKRILEIGPKHGEDSQRLSSLNPSELVLIDLPEKKELVKEWLSRLDDNCNIQHIEGNLLYLTDNQCKQLGNFNLIWCLGVLYHNVEQLRLLKTLFDLCSENGYIVVESATTRNKRLQNTNTVEIHWPDTYRDVQTITHLPSRLAIKSWMEMVGFTHVRIRDVYSKNISWQRVVLTGRKTTESKPYISYSASGLNPTYVAGKAE